MALERLLDDLAVSRLPGLARRLAPSERRRRRCPCFPVSGQAVGAQLGTERDQRREICDCLDGACFGDADEPVRVEVVAQQQTRVGVSGREQPRAPVVEEVALVDRLEPEGVAILSEAGEDRVAFALVLGPKRGLPEPALTRGLEGDRLPETRRYNQPASSFVQYETTMSAPARAMAVRDSSAACRSSTQPCAPAAFSIAYSPETL